MPMEKCLSQSDQYIFHQKNPTAATKREAFQNEINLQ